MQTVVRLRGVKKKPNLCKTMGVVLTTGGFCPERRNAVNNTTSEYDECYKSTDTVERNWGRLNGSKAGAVLKNMEYIQTYPIAN